MIFLLQMKKIYLTNVLLIILIKYIKKTKARIKKHAILVDFHLVGTVNTGGHKMVQLKNYLCNVLYLVANLVGSPKSSININLY